MSILRRALKKLYHILPFKKPLFYLVRFVHVPSSHIYQHLYFKGWFDVKTSKSKFSIFHHGYQIENEIFWKGLEGWEGLSIQLWIKLSTLSDVIIDIGANTGIYALVSKSINPKSKVYAYEPVKRVFDKLVLNINKNKFDIKAEEIAISNHDGTAIIYDQPTEHIYSVTINKNLAHESTVVTPVSIVTKTLSTIIEENKLQKIDLIKIDVETHEPEVLEGLGKYLGLFKPILLLEVLNHDVAERLNQILAFEGYQFYDIYEEGGFKKVDQITFVGEQGYNYLAFPPTRKSVVENIISTLSPK
jgi:FkbM family methyltransferase